MSTLKQAQDYLAGTGGMSTADVARDFIRLAEAAQAAVDMLDTTWVYCPGCECYPAKGEHWPECKVYRLAAVLGEL